ncbi:MAG: WecB/TagA/CpsF family glycosyltransferase [Rhodocyclaceae bacterium]|nr:MAG: WecB/TagA/CpsF family glycosyltransferase [Rhodocyclaceae bacterium]
MAYPAYPLRQTSSPPADEQMRKLPAAESPQSIHRPVHCLLGLPFDAVGMDTAARRIEASARLRRPCVLTTPNVNFVATAFADPAFRDAVMDSHLCVVDGMPLVWIARLLGLPIRERVAGADLFDYLAQQPGRPLRIYLFGGPDGAALAAATAINRRGGGLQCVGFASPGFGSMEDLSSEDILARINASGADFLVLALGAQKGQAWIARNRARLTVPVVSHLGAVINFAAGTVQRAPGWMRRSGLEWLWRIGEEPTLRRRYLHDGALLLSLLVCRVLPLAVYRRLVKLVGWPHAQSRMDSRRDGATTCISFSGTWREDKLTAARGIFETARIAETDIALDLSRLTDMDSAFVGLLMQVYTQQTRRRAAFTMVAASGRARLLLWLHCAEFLMAPSPAKGPPTAA